MEEIQHRHAASQKATLIARPVKTRWGSQSHMLDTVIQNREVVEAVLARLRKEKYKDEDFMALN